MGPVGPVLLLFQKESLRLCTHLGRLVSGWPKSSFGFFLLDGSSSASLSLTSLETMLLDCIVAAVIQWAFQNIIRIGGFCAAILILKMEENMLCFWHIMLYYPRKVEMQQVQKKKICTVYGERVVND